MRSKTSISPWIRAIAIFKLLKAALLILMGIGLLKLLHRDIAEVLEHWINLLQLDPDNQHIQNLMTKVWYVDERKLKELGAGSFCYAALFLTEGTGLLLGKRWAHYLTIIVTASFLPFEVYEIVRQASAVKAGVILVNLAILIYLVATLKKK